MKLRLRICALSALLLSGCNGWELLEKSPAVDRERPYGLTVLAMESCPLPPHLSPKNVALLSYRVRLEGNLKSRVPANYFYAALVTTDGDRYLSTYYGCSPLLSHEPLHPGESAEGYLNFSIPPSKVPAKLVYSPELLGVPSPQALVELSLDDQSKVPADRAPGESL